MQTRMRITLVIIAAAVALALSACAQVTAAPEVTADPEPKVAEAHPEAGQRVTVWAACILASADVAQDALQRADGNAYVALIQNYQRTGCIDIRLTGGSPVTMTVIRPLKQFTTVKGVCFQPYLLSFSDTEFVSWLACKGEGA